MKIESVIFLAVVITLVGCGAGTHTALNSSKNGIVISYDAYGMVPTLTADAKQMAIKHCASYYKDAQYIGWEIPSPLLTKENHGFECVEREIDSNVLVADVERAMTSGKANYYLNNYLDCIRENIVALDDLTSDASTVALAVADMCSTYHYDYIEEIVIQIYYSQDIKGIVREALTSSSNTKVIPYVLNWRKIIKNGFNQSQQPSSNELPNGLYSASVTLEL
jgi:hypothetical protein